MIKAILFDLDGTLVSMEVDFQKMLSGSFEILERFGVPREILNFSKKIIENFQQVKEWMKKNNLDYKNAFQEVENFMKEVELESCKKSLPIEGVKETLKKLKEKKIKIGVITRNHKKATRISLKKASILKYVDLILARDDVELVKPNPHHIKTALKILKVKPEETLVVGDHPFDIEAGKNCETKTVAVLTGSSKLEDLKNADFVIESVKFLEEVL